MGSDGWSRGCTDVDAVQTDGVAVTTVKVSGASRRWLRALLDRSSVLSVGFAAHGEPRALSRRPPTSLYSAVRRGPTNHVGLGAPDQDA